ncbi:fibroblast growth factor 2 isoform X1 [Rhineura floridana]|uniref:fibroblast growth factor 2 isoform X1 n=1 Tax=Rhineura floridana TaxID=261503 RepID=UPI002AC8421F|nr:fibroblast growth factor 2 isoform X1 [Rhineura floridana]
MQAQRSSSRASKQHCNRCTADAREKGAQQKEGDEGELQEAATCRLSAAAPEPAGKPRQRVKHRCPADMREKEEGCNKQKERPAREVVKLLLQAEERGVVSIKGVCANRFLAMNEDGRLLALKYITDECFFFERLESNNYNTYRSRKYCDWYVALKRTGQYKLGPKTGRGQKAILFLPMSAKS